MAARILLLTMLACASVVKAEAQAVECTPKTEQVESGQTPLEKLSDRQLMALTLDLAKRLGFDRSQHDGKAGPDADFLNKWLDRVAEELCKRGYGGRA